MQLLLTCGPSYEPIDGARRLTNMSTGRLGAHLARAFAEAGWDVLCLRGEGATFQGSSDHAIVETFTTNDDLAARMERIARTRRVDAVLHAAALCDFRVARATNAAGEEIRSAKIDTRGGRVVLELEPSIKVLPLLRRWFPSARLVGGKYELSGTRDEAYLRAWRQIRECSSDACVLNGNAYGDGFALCWRDGRVQRVDSAEGLANVLVSRLTPDLATCRL